MTKTTPAPDATPAPIGQLGIGSPKVPVVEMREFRRAPLGHFYMQLRIGRKIARVELNESTGMPRLFDPDKGCYVGHEFSCRQLRRIRRAAAKPPGRNGRDVNGETPMPGSSPGPGTTHASRPEPRQ